MSRIKNIFFCVASVLVILHNLTPHQHHSELSVAEHERQHTSTNVFDFIRSLFHEDFGNQYHLENIEIGSNTPLSISSDFILDSGLNDIFQQPDFLEGGFGIDINSSFYFVFSPTIIQDTSLRRNINYVAPFNASHLLSSVGLRAPPVA